MDAGQRWLEEIVDAQDVVPKMYYLLCRMRNAGKRIEWKGQVCLLSAMRSEKADHQCSIPYESGEVTLYYHACGYSRELSIKYCTPSDETAEEERGGSD